MRFTLKWDKRSIVQSDHVKVPTAIFCTLMTQSLFLEIMRIVIVIVFNSRRYSQRTRVKGVPVHFFWPTTNRYVSQYNVFSWGFNPLKLKKKSTVIRTGNDTSFSDINYVTCHSCTREIRPPSVIEIESSDKSHVCKHLSVRSCFRQSRR